jgi:hypothetical protein
VDRSQPRPSPSAVRDAALGELAEGRLTVERLIALAGESREVLYDVVELPYEGADVRAVDQVRDLAIAAATQLVSRHHEGGDQPAS